MQARCSHERNVSLSVRPSVYPCPTVKRVNCDKMKEIYAHILPTARKTDASNFATRRMVAGDTLFYLKFWTKVLTLQKRRFPIYVRSYIAPQP